MFCLGHKFKGGLTKLVFILKLNPKPVSCTATILLHCAFLVLDLRPDVLGFGCISGTVVMAAF